MASTVNIGSLAITLDNHQAPKAAITTAFDETARANLTDDALRKVRDAATKSNLDDKITKSLQVSSFNPTDMKDPNNFFNFVNQWQAILGLMKEHLQAFFMDSVFNLLAMQVTGALTENQRLEYSARILAFTTDALAAESANVARITRDADGLITSYNDGTNDVNRPAAPATGTTVVSLDHNLLESIEGVTLEQVVASVKIFYDYAHSEVHRQNLVWTYTYMMNSLDADLKQYILSKLSAIEAPYNNTGPVVLFLVAQRLITTTENLAQKVIAAFTSLRLTHFPGESVVECIFTLRNLLKFLRYGETDSYAPRTTTTLLYDVFRGTSVGGFRAYVQSLQDFQLHLDYNPEDLFDKIQLKYDELLLADRWVPQRKKGSSFLAGRYEEAATKPAPVPDTPVPDKPNDTREKDKNGRPIYDKKGNKIDRVPPKRGEPHERTNSKGYKEFWCGNAKCQRWGSHPTKDHDEWRKNSSEYFKKRRAAQGGNSNPNANATTTTTPPPAGGSRTTGSVTFLSALTGGSLRIDPNLADGVDF